MYIEHIFKTCSSRIYQTITIQPKRVFRFLILAILSFSLMGQAALAAAKVKVEVPAAHLTITEVAVSFIDETITIFVEDLDFGPGPLVVRLGDESGFGDISSACVEDVISTPQTLVCDFSATGLNTGLPPDGDYLLLVATGNGTSQSDEYDLSIGAIGPQGEKGEQGPQGEQGIQGEQGLQQTYKDIHI